MSSPKLGDSMKVSEVAILLLISVASTSSQRTLYVRAVTVEDNSPCPGDPCLTFDQYAASPSEYFRSNTVFSFASGVHHLSTSLTIEVDTVFFEGAQRTENSSESRLVCLMASGITFSRTREISVDSLFLESCKTMVMSSSQIRLSNVVFSSKEASCFTASASEIALTNTIFANCSAQQGAGLHVTTSTIEFFGEAVFTSNSASLEGGAIYSEGSTLQFTGNADFNLNIATSGGAIYATKGSTISFSVLSTFTSNTATGAAEMGGGAIFLSSSILQLRGSSGFEYNAVVTHTKDIGNLVGGGAIKATNQSQLIVEQQTGFIRNTAFTGGGLLVENSDLSISGSILFLANSAEGGDGGGLFIGRNSTAECIGKLSFIKNIATLSGGGVAVNNAASVHIDGGLFLTNTAVRSSGGAIDLALCRNASIANSNLTVNTANTSGGAIHTVDSLLTLRGFGFVDGNIAGTGGAITALNSTVTFLGGHHLENNKAVVFGSGCIQAWMSTISIQDNTTFMNNSGTHGGSICAHQSHVESKGEVQFMHNSASNEGGALHASNGGTVTFGGNITLNANSARVGGAIALESGIRMIMASPLQLNVQQNKAEAYGGGIYFAEFASSLRCASNPQILTPSRAPTPSCFMETIGLRENITANFVHNSAGIAGSTLYGGNLDNCRTPLEGEASEELSEVNLLSFWEISTITPPKDNPTSIISSAPVRLCFCDESREPNCSNSIYNVSAYPGETISIPIITLGQGGGAVPTGIQISSLGKIQLSGQEMGQRTGKICSSIDFRIWSEEESEVLVLFPEGACGDIGTAYVEIQVALLPCPIGFSFSQGTKECICESQLHNATCNLNAEEFMLPTKLWISSTIEGNSSGLVTSEQCPLYLCSPPPSQVTLENPDSQCLFNHSGTLCGGCMDGHSTVFGTSRCLPCGNQYLALLAVFAVAGATIVTFLYLGNAGLVQGTASGLLLYANLVQVNQNALLPLNEVNILTVFIAWLNLDFGIETCFYNGMDAYAHTWLQFLFPLYLWMLVCFVSLATFCSQRIKKFIYSHSTSSEVLALLFLLSCTKILRTAATGLSVGKLELTLSPPRFVWRHDGNLSYFHDYRHIILGVASALVMLVTLSIILLILFWNLFPKAVKKFDFLNKFMESFRAQFCPAKLSWVGFLLLCRFYLIVFKIPYFTENFEILNTFIVVSVVILTHTIAIIHKGSLHKHKTNGILEISFTTNLVLFLGTTLYLRATNTENSQGIATNFYLGLAFVQFIGASIYYFYLRFLKSTKTESKMIKFMLEKVRVRRTEENSATEGQLREGEEETTEHALENTFETSFVILKEPLLNSNEQ